MHVLIAALHRAEKPTGVCRHAANLAHCLAEIHRVSCITLVIGTWQKYYFEAAFSLKSEKIQIVDVDINNSSISRNIWFLSGLPKLANQLNPNVVHLSFPLPFLRQCFPCPVVATIHDLYPYEYPENFGRVQAVFNRLFLRQCINQSDGLTCVSQETLKQLKLFFPTACIHKEVTVTYNFVDFSTVVPQCPEVFRGRRIPPFLLSVAQHRKNKNLDLLIQAFTELVKSEKLSEIAELILVGSPGPETENLQQQIAALQFSSRICFLSSITDSELCWLYQQCQVYVVCSSTEGFCIPLAEALYMRCRIVCSDIPILREVGQSDCIYFNLQDQPINQLADAIVEAINRTTPASKTNLRFSKTIIAEQYVDFYLKVKGEHNRRLS